MKLPDSETPPVAVKCQRDERADIARLQQELFAEGVVSRALLDAVPSPLLIVNEAWRVVYANRAVLTLVEGSGTLSLSGLAAGEAFHCVHPRQRGRDAAAHDSCRICGVARVLARALRGEEASEDCRLSCELAGSSSALDLRVWAKPLVFHGEHYSILSLVDIGDTRRKEMLENACFHDLLNTLTSIRGVLSVIKDEEVEDRAGICELLEQMTQGSIDEIMTLRLIEKGDGEDFVPRFAPVATGEFLGILRRTFQRHPAAQGKELIVASDSVDQCVETDRQLLRRITGNMVINALEATEDGRRVTVGCRPNGKGVEIWVHNETAIPRDIQGRIFNDRISTKGTGRGVGTYSIKLLSEKLGGEVRFASSAGAGTTFTLWLPRQPLAGYSA